MVLGVTGSNHGDPMRALGAAIVLHREQAEMTTEQLAKMIDLPPHTLLTIERGEAEPRWGTMRRIAAALEVPLEQIAEVAERFEETGAP